MRGFINSSNFNPLGHNKMNSLSILLGIFQFFGLCTWTPSNSFIRERVLIAWKCIHFGVFFVQNIILVTHIPQIFSTVEVIGFLTDFAQYFGPATAHFVILCESLYYYKEQRTIWKLIFELKTTFSGIRTDLKFLLEDALRRFLVEGMLVALICWLSEATVIYRISYPELLSESWRNHWICKIVPFSIGRMSFFFHAFFIQYIEFYMKILTEEMHYIGIVSRRRKQAHWDFVQERVLLLKEAHAKVSVMNQHVNKMFGFSHVANMLGLFVLISACWYYDCIRIKFKLPLETSINSYLTTVSPMLIVFYFCLRCERALQLIETFPHELYYVGRAKRDNSMSQLISHFGLQLKHQTIKFSARGFFDIGSDFLKELMSQIVNYIIILVQFMPAHTNS